MELYYAAVDTARLFILVVGSLVIFVGVVQAILEAREADGSGRAARSMGAYAALGLEFFVGATLLNLILNPTWVAVATTALTLVVRRLITLSLRNSAQRDQQQRL